MTFLFKMYRTPGVDRERYARAQERARKMWKIAPEVYEGTFFEHLKAGDFDHVIPADWYHLEDCSHLEHRLPPDFVIPRSGNRASGSVVHSGSSPELLPRPEPRPKGEGGVDEVDPFVPPWE